MKQSISISLAIILLSYLGVSFCTLKIDPITWNGNTILLFTMFVFLIVFSIVSYEIIVGFKNKKP